MAVPKDEIKDEMYHLRRQTTVLICTGVNGVLIRICIHHETPSERDSDDGDLCADAEVYRSHE